jgi:hypothetical protein
VKGLLLSAFLLIPVLAHSAGTEIQIYRDGTAVKAITIENYKLRTVIRSKPPHRQLNPEGKTFEFEGVRINELLNLTPKDQNLFVHFVGVDGYISSLPVSILLKTNAILALKRNGQSIADREGGIQVVFPTEGDHSVLPLYAKKAAFWCWYVRSIVVGDLSSNLKIGAVRPTIEQGEAFTFEPPSVFQLQKANCPETFRVPLAKATHIKEVSLHRLSGETKTILSQDYDLLLPKGNKPLSVNCGGPIALINRTRLTPLKPPVLARNIETSVVSIEEIQ